MSLLEFEERLRRSVLAKLLAEADLERAVQQQKYMRSEMPFFGLSVPRCRQIAHDSLRDFPPVDERVWSNSILHLWREASHREERYIAVEIFLHKTCNHWLTPTQVPILEEMVVSGAWWDFVDALAARGAGTMLANDPVHIKLILYQWAEDENIWKRRVAILAQLKSKARTDTELLSRCIQHSIGHTEFFLRKGIGWALREYSKTNANWVIQFVHEHPELSNLSRREALKQILRSN